jgi:hypothetical protein
MALQKHSFLMLFGNHVREALSSCALPLCDCLWQRDDNSAERLHCPSPERQKIPSKMKFNLTEAKLTLENTNRVIENILKLCHWLYVVLHPIASIGIVCDHLAGSITTHYYIVMPTIKNRTIVSTLVSHSAGRVCSDCGSIREEGLARGFFLHENELTG